MTPENFVFWLQGLFELGDVTTLDANQTTLIREHLDLVFTQIAPSEKRDGRTLDERSQQPFKELGAAGFRSGPQEPKRYC